MSAKHIPSSVRPTPVRPSSPLPYRRPDGAVLRDTGQRQPVKSNRNLHSIVLTDVAGSATRDSRGLRRMRDDLYDVIAGVTAENGFELDSLSFDDTGDGLRLIIPLDLMPPTRVVDAFVSGLAAGLREHRRQASEIARIRMRVCFHLGVVEKHRRSWTGDPLVRAARLIEARQLRDALEMWPGTDLAAIVSDAMFEIIQHRAGLLPPEWFQEIQVRVKEFDSRAWLFTPPAMIGCANCTYPQCSAKGVA
jgi:hypothetical protein